MTLSYLLIERRNKWSSFFTSTNVFDVRANISTFRESVFDLSRKCFLLIMKTASIAKTFSIYLESVFDLSWKHFQLIAKKFSIFRENVFDLSRKFRWQVENKIAVSRKCFQHYTKTFAAYRENVFDNVFDVSRSHIRVWFRDGFWSRKLKSFRHRFSWSKIIDWGTRYFSPHFRDQNSPWLKHWALENFGFVIVWSRIWKIYLEFISKTKARICLSRKQIDLSPEIFENRFRCMANQDSW
jgi:hypothetical protein